MEIFFSKCGSLGNFDPEKFVVVYRANVERNITCFKYRYALSSPYTVNSLTSFLDLVFAGNEGPCLSAMSSLSSSLAENELVFLLNIY